MPAVGPEAPDRHALRRCALRGLLLSALLLHLGCAPRPPREPVAAPPPAPPPAAETVPETRPAEPLVRQSEPARSAQTEQELREQLRRDPELSIARAETGYFLDVLQARLLQMQGAGIQVARETGQFRITLAAPMFESGQASLTAEARARVAAVAEVLRVYRATSVVVHGHTDSSGPPQVNLALSRQRAEAVARVLLENGVARARLLAVGHGATLPRADNDSPEGQAANRRVELVLQPVVREPES